MKGSILLVEDNEQIVRGNERILKKQGYAVTAALTLAEARAAVSRGVPDVIVLDIMLPDGSGLGFIRELRRISNVPVLLLTGLTATEDVVRGLTAGGDDYLTKPYDFGVLLARVDALLRRAAHMPATFTKGALCFDILANQAFFNGVDLLLAKKEFALLLLLAKNEGQVLSPEYLYETVWKQPMASDDSAVKTTISRLRKKLGVQMVLQYDNEGEGYTFDSITLEMAEPRG